MESEAQILDICLGLRHSLNFTNDEMCYLGEEKGNLKAIETTNGADFILCTFRKIYSEYMISKYNSPVRIGQTEVKHSSVIRNGDTFVVGGHLLKFLSYKHRSKRKLPKTPGYPRSPVPPPKPPRNNPSADNTSLGAESLSNTDEDTAANPETPGRSAKASFSWTDFEPPLMDLEYLQNKASVDQIASTSCGCIVKQLLIFTDYRPSSSDIAQLSEHLMTMGLDFKDVLLDFLSSYSALTTTSGLRMGAKAVVVFLTELLRHSLDPVSHVLSCVRYMSLLVQAPDLQLTFLTCGASSAVQAAMATYSVSAQIQLQAAEILSELMKSATIHGQKAPFRSGGINLLCRAMKLHMNDPVLVLAVINALLSLIEHLVPSPDSSLTELLKSEALQVVLEASLKHKINADIRQVCSTFQLSVTRL